jgi:hypothetical protein
VSVPVVVVTCPKLAVNPYEGEYDFEQGLNWHRFWPQKRIPRSAFERLFLAALQVKPKHTNEPVRSPDQKEAAREQVALEGTMCWMPNCTRSQRSRRRCRS